MKRKPIQSLQILWRFLDKTRILQISFDVRHEFGFLKKFGQK